MQNAFAGHAKKPTNKQLAEVLGPTHPLWQALVTELTRDFKLDRAEWHSSSTKLGWSYRMQLKKRNIIYLGPRRGCFLACFALGDKAIAAARESDLSPSVQKNIADSKRYAEGTAVRIEVNSPEDLPTIKTLTRIKIEN